MSLQTASCFAPATSRCCRTTGTRLFTTDQNAKRPFSGERRPFTKSGATLSPSPAHPPRQRRSTSKKAPTSSRMSSAVLEAPRPTMEPSKVADFQDRMRQLVTPKTRRKSRTDSPRHPNVRVVRTLAEYKEVVGDETDKLVVVRFYATWCKACKAMAPLFYRLASTYKDTVFVEVPVTDKNAALHQGLGVPSLPFGHIYHPKAGLVEELKINRKFFSEFAHTVKAHRSGSCELRDGECTNPFRTAEE